MGTQGREPLDLDKFYMQDHLAVTQGAFRVLTALQSRPEFLVASVAALFILICERWQIRPTVALDAASRMLKDSRKRDNGGHFAAISRTLEDDGMWPETGYRSG
jgi:hypothetical protein